MQCGNQILLTSALEFGNVVFPEFADLPEQEKVVLEYHFSYETHDFSVAAAYRVLLPLSNI